MTDIVNKIKSALKTQLEADSSFDGVNIVLQWAQKINEIKIPAITIRCDPVQAVEVGLGRYATSSIKDMAYRAFVSFHCWARQNTTPNEDDSKYAIELADKILTFFRDISPSSALFAAGIREVEDLSASEAHITTAFSLRRCIVEGIFLYCKY